MKREVLLNHECLAIAAKNGLAGLHEYTHHEHLQKVLRSNHNYLDGPATVAKAFYFNPACGECGVIFATAGLGPEEDTLEGVRFHFEPSEAMEAEAALLKELRQYDEQPSNAGLRLV